MFSFLEPFLVIKKNKAREEVRKILKREIVLKKLNVIINQDN